MSAYYVLANMNLYTCAKVIEGAWDEAKGPNSFLSFSSTASMSLSLSTLLNTGVRSRGACGAGAE